jgi:uncharacterized protein YegP (UPF0339 family)
MMEFAIHRAVGGQYYWRIVASNGQVLANSETYLTKRDAYKGARHREDLRGERQVIDLPAQKPLVSPGSLPRVQSLTDGTRSGGLP